MNAVEMLLNDHEKVRKLFQEYQQAGPQSREGRDTAQQALMEIMIHSKLEEEIFYPAVRNKGGQEIQGTVEEGYQEHATVDNMIEQLRAMNPTDEQFHTMFRELMQNVEHHVQEEESELLPQARQRLGDDADQLGHEMAQRREQLLQQLVPQMG